MEPHLNGRILHQLDHAHRTTVAWSHGSVSCSGMRGQTLRSHSLHLNVPNLVVLFGSDQGSMEDRSRPPIVVEYDPKSDTRDMVDEFHG